MLRALFGILRTHDPLQAIGESFGRMLKLTLEMTLSAGDIAFGGETTPGGRTRIYELDIEVNQLAAKQAALYRRRVVGVVFQFFNLLPMFTVAENVAFPLELDGVRPPQLNSAVDELLRELEMLDCRDRYPDQLSGGQLQRVAIARALSTNPDPTVSAN